MLKLHSNNKKIDLDEKDKGDVDIESDEFKIKCSRMGCYGTFELTKEEQKKYGLPEKCSRSALYAAQIRIDVKKELDAERKMRNNNTICKKLCCIM